MEYLLVGLGGMLGSITRFSLGRIFIRNYTGRFPFSTFIINITGALLLGFVSALGVNRTLNLFAVDGFLGAYTTFSTFMYEGFNLFHGNQRLNASIYIGASLMLGIAGFFIGFEGYKLLLAHL